LRFIKGNVHNVYALVKIITIPFKKILFLLFINII
jgi:hypothetical protein